MLVMHYGVWDAWGFEFSFSPNDGILAIAVLHWYVAFEWAD
jgi:hypothetical protein